MKKNIIDITELEEFESGMIQMQQQYEQFVRGFLLEQGLRALRLIKTKTPVDSGFLNKNWFLGDVLCCGTELYIDIYNTADYASYVEDGYHQKKRWVPGHWEGARFVYNPNDETGTMLNGKWVEGRHMLKLSIDEIEATMPRKYEVAFKRFLNGLGLG